MENFKVSILIPTFNSELYIEAAIESVLNQSWKFIEIIIIDDHSTDDTWHILMDYQYRHPQLIKVYKNPRKGAPSARNFGFEKSSGDYIQFLDSDDLLSPHKISNQINTLQDAARGAIAFCPWGHFLKNPAEAIFYNQKTNKDYATGVEWLVDAWQNGEMVQTACWLTPRHLIEKAGLWKEELKINQDGEFFCRVLLQSSGVKFVSKSKVYYRRPQAGISVSKRRSEGAITSFLISYESYEREIIKIENSERVRIAIAQNYFRFIYQNHPHYPDLLSRAWEGIKRMGCSEPIDIGGKKFNFIAKYVGFNNALQLKLYLSSFIN